VTDHSKKCSRCDEAKPLTEFNRKKSTPDGRRAECRECTRAYRERVSDQIKEYNADYYQAKRDSIVEQQRLYYLANRERIAKRNAEYRAKNHDAWKAFRAEWEKQNPGYNRWARLKHHYGITQNEYWAMFEAQQGLCAICREGCPLHEFLSVDHCHLTGRVRGLLCAPCNNGLGFFRDRPELLNEAATYLAA
jgi:hypothetical protein